MLKKENVLAAIDSTLDYARDHACTSSEALMMVRGRIAGMEDVSESHAETKTETFSRGTTESTFGNNDDINMIIEALKRFGIKVSNEDALRRRMQENRDNMESWSKRHHHNEEPLDFLRKSFEMFADPRMRDAMRGLRDAFDPSKWPK